MGTTQRISAMAMASVALDSTWQQVFDGTVDNVIIQASAACEMAIATSAPSGGSVDIAIKLREKPAGSGYEFASSGLFGQKIYMRETSGERNAVANVAYW